MNAARAWACSRPAAALLAVVLGLAVLARYGPGFGGWIASVAAVVLVVLSVIDVEQRRLPNAIVLPSAGVVFAARMATEPAHWRLWLVATLLPALGFLTLAAVYPAGLGLGDVKLTLLLGALLGGDVLTGLFVGTVAAALVGVVLLARHGRSARQRTLPFGPFLAFGALTLLLAAAPYA